MYNMDYSSDLSSCKGSLLDEVLNGDSHLKYAIGDDFADIEKLVSLEHSPLGAIVVCREFARAKQLGSDECLHIASFFCGDIDEHEFEKKSISNYFCQKLHELDFNMFMGKAKKYFYGRSHEQIATDLDSMLIKLGGRDFRHITTTRWGVNSIGC